MFSFGEILERLGDRLGDAPALIHAGNATSWATLDQRSNALAAGFVAAGAQAGDRVAHLMRNSPAYLTTTVAALKARMVHVNVNYRYTGEELFHILDNSDAAVIVFDAEFAEAIGALRPRLPAAKLWLQVGGTPAPFAKAFETVASGTASPIRAMHRPEDHLFLYTGGTTGSPKGVIWEQGTLFALLGGGALFPGQPGPASLEDHIARIAAAPSRRSVLVLPPLMHGTGLLMAIYALALGGTVLTAAGRSFDPGEALALCEAHAPDICVIVGDAFARPMLRALEAGEGRLGGVRTMVSSGTMWSPHVKAGLLAHAPRMLCVDAFGSSEGLGYGTAITTAANAAAPTRFHHDPNTLVIDDAMQPIPPGSGRIGRVARAGPGPVGYWKDPERTAATFVTINGRRHTLPGDWATVDADGAIILLGRGSQCINSGGEKIFPEEVEEALKTHAAVEDALVFGIPDDSFGEVIAAAVETRVAVTTADLIAHVKTKIAAYKAPKTLVFVPTIPRGPNGKPDYTEARRLAGF
jgi:fatty-acyl-CoA synthase